MHNDTFCLCKCKKIIHRKNNRKKQTHQHIKGWFWRKKKYGQFLFSTSMFKLTGNKINTAKNGQGYSRQNVDTLIQLYTDMCGYLNTVISLADH